MNKSKKKIILIVIGILIVLTIVAISSFTVWYKNSLKAISKSSKEGTVRITIPEKTSTTDITKILYNKGLIKNALAVNIYIRINGISNLQAGKYELKRNEDVPTKYWFLTDEIKDEQIYYPLEGYLLPDTYTFENDDVSVKTIFNIILNYMDKKLTSLKEQIEQKNYTIHQMLTLASMAELEGKSDSDRAEIVGVFFNRLNQNMSLGSDVTTYYAFKVDMGDRNLTTNEIKTYSPYNTRGPQMNGKIPIGPICNPSVSAIKAALNPTESDNLYFVADKNGKVYFTKTYEEHTEMIQKLKDEGLWFTY